MYILDEYCIYYRYAFLPSGLAPPTHQLPPTELCTRLGCWPGYLLLPVAEEDALSEILVRVFTLVSGGKGRERMGRILVSLLKSVNFVNRNYSPFLCKLG